MKATRQDSIIKAIEPLINAIGAAFVEPEAVKASDVPIEIDGEVVVGIRLPALHGALERMIDSVERLNSVRFVCSMSAARSLYAGLLKTSPTQWESRASPSTTTSIHFTAKSI